MYRDEQIFLLILRSHSIDPTFCTRFCRKFLRGPLQFMSILQYFGAVAILYFIHPMSCTFCMVWSCAGVVRLVWPSDTFCSSRLIRLCFNIDEIPSKVWSLELVLKRTSKRKRGTSVLRSLSVEFYKNLHFRLVILLLRTSKILISFCPFFIGILWWTRWGH